MLSVVVGATHSPAVIRLRTQRFLRIKVRLIAVRHATSQLHEALFDTAPGQPKIQRGWRHLDSDGSGNMRMRLIVDDPEVFKDEVFDSHDVAVNH